MWTPRLRRAPGCPDGSGPSDASGRTALLQELLGSKGTDKLDRAALLLRLRCRAFVSLMLHAIEFRALTMSDLPLLHEWLTRPHVREWWGAPDTLEEITAEYGPVIAGTLPHECFLALKDQTPIGFIQSYVPALCHEEGWWLDEHEPGVRGIDQFLANSDQLGQGLGTAMVRRFVLRLFADASVTRVQTDPDPTNGRAIRCYEKAGFGAVREVDTPDGRALLMYCDRPMDDAHVARERRNRESAAP
jgi:aminoglycoside 6'-N-acetyltransferase Ib